MQIHLDMFLQCVGIKGKFPWNFLYMFRRKSFISWVYVATFYVCRERKKIMLRKRNTLLVL
jgi:hypothetical protein